MSTLKVNTLNSKSSSTISIPAGTTLSIAGTLATTGSGAITLADDAVTTAKILDANVTLAKMAVNSIDSDQYVDGSSPHADSATFVAADGEVNAEIGATYNDSAFAYTTPAATDKTSDEQAVITARTNAVTKLKALGLTDAEVAAIGKGLA